MSIWAELLPDLEDLDAHGGGPDWVEDQVWESLYEITKRLTSKKVDETCRRQILNAVLPFIESGNSGAVDALDELAYAAERAQESGDRAAWIELQFDQATDDLTFDKYKQFKAACQIEEWKTYEPRLLFVRKTKVSQ